MTFDEMGWPTCPKCGAPLNIGFYSNVNAGRRQCGKCGWTEYVNLEVESK
jgi:ribosomal protein S27AE